MMEITVSITAPNQAHPLPFKRPQVTKILAIPSSSISLGANLSTSG
jgi:hypothetical protein